MRPHSCPNACKTCSRDEEEEGVTTVEVAEVVEEEEVAVVADEEVVECLFAASWLRGVGSGETNTSTAHAKMSSVRLEPNNARACDAATVVEVAAVITFSADAAVSSPEASVLSTVEDASDTCVFFKR